MTYIAGAKKPCDTGDTYFKEINKSSGFRQIESRKLLQNKTLSDITLEARIEYARYIVDCPNCRSAEFAFEDNLFFCSVCKNSNIQGKVYRVKMPDKRKEIENVLSVRPIINRHWYPKETIEDLKKENVFHELGLG